MRAAICLALLAAPALAAPALPALVVDPATRLPARLNGEAARLRVAPGAASMPLVSAALAERAGLKGGMFTMRYMVGPVAVDARTAVARIDFDQGGGRGGGAGAGRRRVAWTERALPGDIDGVVGPGGLPQAVVRFQLRPASAGERTAALPMIDGGGIAGSWTPLYALVQVGTTPVRVSFNPDRETTDATAGAAVALADAYRGRMEGATETRAVAFGVVRPVRRMRLLTPFAVGPLAISTLAVRVEDFGHAGGIAADTDDPADVLVQARGKRRRRHDAVSIGADLLARCSSIVFDKPAKQVRLSCS